MDQAYLRRVLPSSDVLLAKEPEELGAHIVEAIRRDNQGQNHSGYIFSVFYPNHPIAGFDGFSPAHRREVELAIYEAWSWLEAQGLLVWSDAANGANGFRTLSRRGRNLEIEEFTDFAVARALPREILHPSIRDRVWGDFIRGNYDSAVLFAAKQVEVSVRRAANLGNDKYGVPMVREAFHSQNGLLTDPDAEPAEKEARANLFAGFIGAYKNPHSHRDIDIEDPNEAIEIVLMASHLLRIVDVRRQAFA